MPKYVVERNIGAIETAIIEAADEEEALEKARWGDDDPEWEQTSSWVETDMEYTVQDISHQKEAA